MSLDGKAGTYGLSSTYSASAGGVNVSIQVRAAEAIN
jgi:hypothetical protein